MRLGRSRARTARDDDGAAAVEFALVVTPLLLIVFGIITFGIIFSQQLALGNAARQGARFGAVADRTCADIITETRNNALALAMPQSGVNISVVRGTYDCSTGSSTDKPCAGSSPGESVQVKATFTSQPLVPLVITNAVNLSGEGTFRCEFS